MTPPPSWRRCCLADRFRRRHPGLDALDGRDHIDPLLQHRAQLVAKTERPRQIASQAARLLAKRVLTQTNALVAFAEQRRDKPAVVRIIPAPVDAHAAASAERAQNP